MNFSLVVRLTLFLEFKTNDKDDKLKWIFNTYAITLIISVFSALYSIKIGTTVASVGSVFSDTRKVKFLSLPETIKEKSTFRAKALARMSMYSIFVQRNKDAYIYILFDLTLY